MMQYRNSVYKHPTTTELFKYQNLIINISNIMSKLVAYPMQVNYIFSPFLKR